METRRAFLEDHGPLAISHKGPRPELLLADGRRIRKPRDLSPWLADDAVCQEKLRRHKELSAMTGLDWTGIGIGMTAMTAHIVIVPLALGWVSSPIPEMTADDWMLAEVGTAAVGLVATSGLILFNADRLERARDGRR